jgi:hypothetical protein
LVPKALDHPYLHGLIGQQSVSNWRQRNAHSEEDALAKAFSGGAVVILISGIASTSAELLLTLSLT